MPGKVKQPHLDAGNLVNWHSPHIERLFDERKKNKLHVDDVIDRIEKLTGARPTRKITQQRARRYFEKCEKLKNIARTAELDRIAASAKAPTDNRNISEVHEKLNPPFHVSPSINDNYVSYYDHATPLDHPQNMDYTFQCNWDYRATNFGYWQDYDGYQYQSYGATQTYGYCEEFFMQQSYCQPSNYEYDFNAPCNQITPQIEIPRSKSTETQPQPENSLYKVAQVSETVTLTILEPKNS